MGRVVAEGEPLWLDEDRAWALALLDVEADACPECGQPWSEATDPEPSSPTRRTSSNAMPAPPRPHGCAPTRTTKGPRTACTSTSNASNGGESWSPVPSPSGCARTSAATRAACAPPPAAPPSSPGRARPSARPCSPDSPSRQPPRPGSTRPCPTCGPSRAPRPGTCPSCAPQPWKRARPPATRPPRPPTPRRSWRAPACPWRTSPAAPSRAALALAASGQLDLAESATVAAQTMNTFGLAGKDVTHIADVLSASANKSAADVHGLGMSLRMGGLLAKQTGLSLEDTVGTLSAFADHALIGSDAGTSLKTMLQRLVPQSERGPGDGQDRLHRLRQPGASSSACPSWPAMKTSFSSSPPRPATRLGDHLRRGRGALGDDPVRARLQGIDKYVKRQRPGRRRPDGVHPDRQPHRRPGAAARRHRSRPDRGRVVGQRRAARHDAVGHQAHQRLQRPAAGLQHAVTLLHRPRRRGALAGAGILLLLPRIAATRAALAAMGVTAARPGPR
jgi:hypothetical protein